MFVISTLIGVLCLCAGGFLGYWLGFDQGRRSFKAALLERKATSANPEELARWRDVIDTL